MTRDAFDQMVSSLEAKYRGKHAALARRAILFAVLGYAGLALALLTGAAICALAAGMILLKPGFITIKLGLLLGIPAAVVTWAVLKGLWVRLSPPEGLPIRRQDAPALFGMIDEISQKAGGVKFDQVLLTDDLNAAVTQVPRLGIFGWYKTYLLLGLPLMDAMAPEEFKSVVAHEFAHLSHQHGRLGSWLYRLRASWERVMASLAEQGAPKPLLAFIDWFWPRFNASAFVLSRSQEYQADAFAASVTSPQSSASGLQRLAVESRRLGDSFWNGIGREMSSRPQPPDDVFQRMQAFFGTEPDRSMATRWLASALAMKTDTTDTHPGLTDRLAALGVTARNEDLPPLPSKHASDEWLDPVRAKEARDRFSRAWQERIAPQWEETHGEKQELKKQLETSGAGVLDVWDHLILRARIDGMDSIQGDLVSFLAANPDHTMANYFRGRYLAEEDDASGIPLLEKAAVRPDLFHEALGTIAGLCDRLGRGDEIPALKRRADAHDAKMQFALQERNDAKKDDRFLAPDLEPEEMDKLLAAIAKHENVRAAWLVKKEVQHFPEWRTYVLALDIHWPALRLVGNDASMKILRQILDDFTIDAFVLALLRDSDQKPVIKVIEKVEGAALPLRKD